MIGDEGQIVFAPLVEVPESVAYRDLVVKLRRDGIARGSCETDARAQNGCLDDAAAMEHCDAPFEPRVLLRPEGKLALGAVAVPRQLDFPPDPVRQVLGLREPDGERPRLEVLRQLLGRERGRERIPRLVGGGDSDADERRGIRDEAFIGLPQLALLAHE